MGCDAGCSKGVPKLSSVSSSDENWECCHLNPKFSHQGAKSGGDGDRILGPGSVGRLSKFIGGLGVGKKGDGDRMEHGGDVVFGEETEGEGISNSL